MLALPLAPLSCSSLCRWLLEECLCTLLMPVNMLASLFYSLSHTFHSSQCNFDVCHSSCPHTSHFPSPHGVHVLPILPLYFLSVAAAESVSDIHIGGITRMPTWGICICTVGRQYKINKMKRKIGQESDFAILNVQSAIDIMQNSSLTKPQFVSKYGEN